MVSKIKRVDKKIIEEFRLLSTCNVSDALDKLGLTCGTYGIIPLYNNCKKLVGSAITQKVIAYGPSHLEGHMGAKTIEIAQPGDVIVIDNSGRIDQNCWGEILTYSAIQKGVNGVVIDGASRDIDVIQEIGFPLYARGIVPHTARGRCVQASVGSLIQIGGVQVRPGDIIMADINGVVVIPLKKAEEVLKVSNEIYKKEENIIRKIKEGQSFSEVDRKSGYDKMLENN